MSKKKNQKNLAREVFNNRTLKVNITYSYLFSLRKEIFCFRKLIGNLCFGVPLLEYVLIFRLTSSGIQSKLNWIFQKFSGYN